MTASVLSVKHIKAEYRRYQLIAIASAIVAIVSITLAAVTSFQMAHLASERARTLKAEQHQADQLKQRDSAAVQERLAQMERQLAAEKAVVQQLNARIAGLQKQLAENDKSPGLDSKPTPVPAGADSPLIPGAGPLPAQ